jgi:hypothetical protein
VFAAQFFGNQHLDKGKSKMKTISSVSIGSFVLYGAVLAAFWTFAFGLWYWILGWMFGASSTWIDMNLGNWTSYTINTFLFVFARSLVNAVGGAFGGLLVALVYNVVAGMMGGIKLNLKDSD